MKIREPQENIPMLRYMTLMHLQSSLRLLGIMSAGIALLFVASWSVALMVYAGRLPAVFHADATLHADSSKPVAPDSDASSAVPSGYHLTFDDEFLALSISDEDGTGAKWHTNTVQCCMFDTSAPSTPTYMAGVSAPDGQQPYSLVPGQGLAIRLQKTNGRWYSGVLATVDRHGRGFAQQYGYFEMRAKFPHAPGAWPAFWLLNSAALTEHAPAGEIDVVESFMFAPNYINSTLHDWTPPAKTVAHHLAKVADLSDGFHTFGLLWTASTMRFSCDGQVYFTVSTPPIMQQPYYPIVDLGLGGGWPTRETPRTNNLLVRYVRVYAPDTQPTTAAQ